jgi:hypothetical protein
MEPKKEVFEKLRLIGKLNWSKGVTEVSYLFPTSKNLEKLKIINKHTKHKHMNSTTGYYWACPCFAYTISSFVIGIEELVELFEKGIIFNPSVITLTLKEETTSESGLHFRCDFPVIRNLNIELENFKPMINNLVNLKDFLKNHRDKNFSVEFK